MEDEDKTFEPDIVSMVFGGLFLFTDVLHKISMEALYLWRGQNDFRLAMRTHVASCILSWAKRITNVLLAILVIL